MAKRFLKQIRGLQVVGLNGAVFGEIDDLEVEGNRVTGLVVRVLAKHVKELGLKKPFWSQAQVLVPARYIRSVAEVVVLRISLSEFGKRLAEIRGQGKTSISM